MSETPARGWDRGLRACPLTDDERVDVWPARTGVLPDFHGIMGVLSEQLASFRLDAREEKRLEQAGGELPMGHF